MPDPLKDLTAAGVSIWLDDLSRRLLTSGALHRLVDERHVVGITSNPTIFSNAIGGSADYADQIRELGQRGTPTHPGRPACHRTVSGGRDQHQRHADLLP